MQEDYTDYNHWPGPYVLEIPALGAPATVSRPSSTSYPTTPLHTPLPKGDKPVLKLRATAVTFGELRLRNGFKINGYEIQGRVANGTRLPYPEDLIEVILPGGSNGLKCKVVEFAYESSSPGYTDYVLTVREEI